MNAVRRTTMKFSIPIHLFECTARTNICATQFLRRKLYPYNLLLATQFTFIFFFMYKERNSIIYANLNVLSDIKLMCS